MLVQNKQTPSKIKSTFDPAKHFARYDPSECDFIALHRWSDKKTLATGKAVDLGKAPVDARWSTMAVDARKTRARCLKNNRNMGIRLRPGQLVVDVDPRNGGEEGFRNLCYHIGLNADEWPRVITGSGGFHCYMSLPDNFRVQETLEEYPGVEFKSVGRQVVAAGSRHPNGKFYRWSKDHPNIEDGLPMAPTTLLKAIRRPERSGGLTTGGGQYTPEQLATALAGLDPEEFRVELEWRILMMACHHATNGGGEDEFVRWSASDPQFAGQASPVIKRWRSCSNKPNAYTYKTLNFILRQHGAASLQVAPEVADDEFPDDVSEERNDSEVMNDNETFAVLRD